MAGFGTDHYLEAYGIATRTLVENLGLDTPTLRDWQFPCSFPTRNEVTELLEVMAASSRIILRMCLMDIRLNLGECDKYGLLTHFIRYCENQHSWVCVYYWSSFFVTVCHDLIKPCFYYDNALNLGPSSMSKRLIVYCLMSTLIRRACWVWLLVLYCGRW